MIAECPQPRHSWQWVPWGSVGAWEGFWNRDMGFWGVFLVLGGCRSRIRGGNNGWMGTSIRRGGYGAEGSGVWLFRGCDVICRGFGHWGRSACLRGGRWWGPVLGRVPIAETGGPAAWCILWAGWGRVAAGYCSRGWPFKAFCWAFHQNGWW